MKIPGDSKRIIVTNGKSAFEGTLAHTKNINLDNPGYIELSAPMVKVLSDNTTDYGATASALGLPIEAFQHKDNVVKAVSVGAAYNINLATISGAASKDTDYTGWISSSRIINWVSDNWFLNGGDIYNYDGATTYVLKISSEIGRASCRERV